MIKVSAAAASASPLRLNTSTSLEPSWELLLPPTSRTLVLSTTPRRTDITEQSKIITRTDPRIQVIRRLREPLESALQQSLQLNDASSVEQSWAARTVRSSQDHERCAVRTEARGRLFALQGDLTSASILYREAAVHFASAVRCLLPTATDLPIREVVLTQLEYEQQHIPRAARLVDDRKAVLHALSLPSDSSERTTFQEKQCLHARDLLTSALQSYHTLRDHLDSSRALLRRACILDEGATIASLSANRLLEQTLRKEAEYTIREALETLQASGDRVPSRPVRRLRSSELRASLLMERLAFHALGDLDERRAVITACRELIMAGDIETPRAALEASGFISPRPSRTDPVSALSQGLEVLIAPLGSEAVPILTDLRLEMERCRLRPLWTQLQGLQPGVPAIRRARAIEALEQLLPANFPLTFDNIRASIFLVSSPDVPFLAFSFEGENPHRGSTSGDDLALSGFAATLRNGVRATFTDLASPSYAASSLHEASHILTSIEWGGIPQSVEELLIDELAARLTDLSPRAPSCRSHMGILVDVYLHSFIKQLGRTAHRENSRSLTSRLSLRAELEEWQSEPYRTRKISELYQAAAAIDRWCEGSPPAVRLNARRALLDSRSFRHTVQLFSCLSPPDTE